MGKTYDDPSNRLAQVWFCELEGCVSFGLPSWRWRLSYRGQRWPTTGRVARGVAAVPLVLHPDRNACRLIALSDEADRSERLSIGGLCRFHRDPEGEVCMKNTSQGDVILVEISVQSPEDSGDCRTEMQAVRLGAEGPELAPKPALVASGPPFQWDDVMFLGVV